MALTITINRSPAPAADYLTWAPSPCTLQQDSAGPIAVRLRNANPEDGGQLVFRASTAGPFSDELDVDVPPGNEPLEVQIAGKFRHPSKADKDAAVEVIERPTNAVLASRPLMVRVRKDANTLTAAERNRFLSALVRLNTQDNDGLVPFLDIQRMHVRTTDAEIHGRESFLPWHRAFILDIERRLQAIDPSVTMPYWRFDRAAPRVFTRHFMGVPLEDGIVDFAATNPLINWINRLGGAGNARIRRFNGMAERNEFGRVVGLIPFDPTKGRAIAVSNGQNDTINLGLDGAGQHAFERFAQMELDPHGAAHVSFVGQIASPSTAPADPLFFLLHCNIDRLWARWQWLADKFDDTDPTTYSRIGSGDPAVGGRNGIGNYSLDTMWPWNGDTYPPRPTDAPGGPFPGTELFGPPPKPTVGSMIDYLGQRQGSRGLGFAYDNVPFEV